MHNPEEKFEIPTELRDFGAQTAIVLGSGLGSLADQIEEPLCIPYSQIPGFPVSRVPGHEGAFVAGTFAGTRLLVASGRVHVYEGWSAREVATGVRLMHGLGIRTLLLTNAAGTLNTGFYPGTWMMLCDHLNLQGTSPLEGGPNFIDCTTVYDAELRKQFAAAASSGKTILHVGTYAAMRGPQYETPAEIRMLRFLGADAAGMSTVPEALQARALGMRVAAFSCLTNWGAGLAPGTLDHSEVTTAGKQAADSFIKILRVFLGTTTDKFQLA
jgi:purine-nucleoside phosphorylase